MPRRGRRTAIRIADLERAAGGCHVCRRPIEAGDAVAWTWARQRIHEACMPIWTITSRRPFGAWVAEAVRLVLDRSGGRLCTGCLALGLSLSLADARDIVAVTCTVPGFRVLPVSCSECGRTTDALCTVPPDVVAFSPPADAATAKCTHCSKPLAGGALGVDVGDDRFHRSCWLLLLSNEKIQTSRVLSRGSRQLLARTRALVDRPPAGQI